MAFRKRKQLIQQIQNLRGSKVITLVNSDRPYDGPPPLGITTGIESEAQIFFYDHLLAMGQVNNLDLFLYTRGGETDAVWPLVNMLRERCKKLSVLVPFRAHSAGTMICLGANEVVLGELAGLSPIDPTTGNQFNPRDEVDKRTILGISVEDVTSYMNLARDQKKVGLKNPSHILEVFQTLSEKVHPLALGNVNRVHTRIRALGLKLLALHIDVKKERKKVDEVIDTLTERLYAHTHYIGREEAIQVLDIGGFVKYASPDEQNVMWGLFEEYTTLFDLRKRFSLNSYMVGQQERELIARGGAIESENMSHLYLTKTKITKMATTFPGMPAQAQPGVGPPIAGLPPQYLFEVASRGWERNSRGI